MSFEKIGELIRIKTENSVYEILLKQDRTSVVRKVGNIAWSVVADTTFDYLGELRIGDRFLIPGVVETSIVQDYERWIRATDPKRYTPAQQVEADFGQIVLRLIHGAIEPPV